MKVVLLYMSGALQGREKSCEALPVRLGADPAGDIFFDAFAHRMVSRSHALISWENGGWTLRDQSGGKGTQLNGQPVEEGRAAPLKMGDRIQLGLEGPQIAVVLLDTEGQTPAPVESESDPPTPSVPMKANPAVAGMPPPPLTLEFTEGARQGTKRTFNEPQVSLGRKADNSLVFDHAEDSAASGKHAYIFWAEGRYQLHDHNSTNGTYLNGLRVTTASLSGGDVIQLTPHGVKLKVAVGESEAETTQPMAATPANAPPSLTLEFISGERKGESLTFTQPEIRLGRKPENDVAVGDKASGISSEHALIKFVNGEYLLLDTNSTNGTYLDGKKIESQPLHDGSLIRITAWGPELRVKLGLPGAGEKKVGADTMRLAISAAVEQARAEARGAPPMNPGKSKRDGPGLLTALFLLLLLSAFAGVLLLGRYFWNRMQPATVVISTSGATGETASAGGAADRLSKADIFNRNQGGVVFIRHTHVNDGKESTTEGTGFCVDESGLIITNRHVGAPWSSNLPGGSGTGRTVRIEIFFSGNRESRPGKLLREHADPEVDLALLAVEEGSGLPAVSGLARDDRAIRVGDEIYIIGYPLGSAIYSEGGVKSPSFNPGTLSKKTSRRLQYDATTFPGSSGSPVFDDAGNVIAVHFAGQANGAEKAAGINYGIPVQFVQELLKAEGKKE